MESFLLKRISQVASLPIDGSDLDGASNDDLLVEIISLRTLVRKIHVEATNEESDEEKPVTSERTWSSSSSGSLDMPTAAAMIMRAKRWKIRGRSEESIQGSNRSKIVDVRGLQPISLGEISSDESQAIERSRTNTVEGVRELNTPTKLEIVSSSESQAIERSRTNTLEGVGKRSTTAGRALQVSGYEIGSLIGTGLTAHVYVGTNGKTREKVALKVIPIFEEALSVEAAEMEWEVELRLNRDSPEWHRILSEVNAMRQIPDHPNVLSLIDVDFDALFPCKAVNPHLSRTTVFPVVLIVLPLAPFNNLESLMGNDFETRCGLSEDVSRSLFLEIVHGLLHCHKHNVFHRDLKPANILLSKEMRPQLADFGFASIFAKGMNPLSEHVFTMAGSDEYAAPEVISMETEGGYRAEDADIWSLGVILYELLVGKPPWTCADPDMDCDYYNVSEGDYDTFWEEHDSQGLPELNEDIRDLIEKMLNPEGKARIRLAQVLEHDWIQNGEVEGTSEKIKILLEEQEGVTGRAIIN
eukprot:g6000.t1